MRVIAFFCLFMIWPYYGWTQTISIASWNMEWLSLHSKHLEGQRNSRDYQKLQQIFSDMAPDILAFQEVDTVDALKMVVPDSGYDFFFSDRTMHPHSQHKGVNQYTGFAVRNDLSVIDPADLVQLNIGKANKTGKLRYGSYIIVTSKQGKPIHLMSVHLKSGCFSATYSKRRKSQKACRQLEKQAMVLAEWINQRLIANDNYIIIGDFNHRLNSQHDWLLTKLKDMVIDANVYNLTRHLSASCYARVFNKKNKASIRRYDELIDHALANKAIKEQVSQQGSARQYRFTLTDIKRFRLTDHCPIQIRVPLKA